MKRQIIWLILNSLMALSLLLASCAPAVTEKEEAPPEEEKVTPTEEAVVPAKEEEVTLAQEAESIIPPVVAEEAIPEESITTVTPAPREPMPQGFSPFAIVITEDGQYAYLSSDFSEVVFKMHLEDFTVEAVAELYEYFPTESKLIALDASEEYFFVPTPIWRKLLVFNTQTMSLVRTIDDIGVIGMIRSRYSPFLITWDGGNAVKFVNTETYEVTESRDDRMKFVKIRESTVDQDKWCVVSGGPSEGYSVGIYDHKTKAWSYEVSLPLQREDEAIFALEVLPNEEKAYVATLGGWYPEYHAYGWLYSIDLVGGESPKVIPIDGGALCLEASPDNRRLYVGTGWPVPDVNNILVLDTQSDGIVGQVDLGSNKYGWPHTEMHDLQIDPANSRVLYATIGDATEFVKVDLDSLTVAEEIVFSQASFRPHFFVRKPGQATGYIFIHQSNKAFELDLNKATIEGVVELPLTRDDAYAYSGEIDDAGRLLLVLGEAVLEVDVGDMRLLGTHPLPQEFPSVWHVVLSRDQQRLYSVAYARGEEQNQPNTFVAINTVNFQVGAVLRLEGGAFNGRPFELPDGSKVYAVGGLQNGQVVVQVIETENYTITKTITFDEPGSLGISTGNYYPFAYDSNSHTLFVGATHVVLAIDTDTDTVQKVIYLGDVAGAVDLQQLLYINAIGLVYHPRENYLYIVHLDRSFVSIYDLNTNQFLPQVIPSKGLMPQFVFANDDYSKIYILNRHADSVSVIDVDSKAVEKVIDLHAYR